MKEQGRYFIYIIALLFLLSSCANRVTPTGGAKDVKPPVVDTMLPNNYTVNFNSRKVEIKFDEFVKLKDLQKQLIVSPLMDPAPVITVKKKSVIIELPKDLRASTTYTLNFGNAIADIHEDNSIESFQYVFSTGAILDSLYCKGKALDAYKQKGEKGIAILLYRTIDDSLPLKSKPDYFARTNENGEFRISNISDGQYLIVAVNDKNGNYKCDSPQEEAVSLSEIVVPDTNEIELNYFNELPSTLYIKKIIYGGNKKWIILINKPSDSISVKPLNINQPAFLESWNERRDTLMIWCADTLKDSLNLQVFNNKQIADTARIRLKIAAPVKDRGGDFEKGNKNNFVESFNMENGLKPLSNPEIIFKSPMKNIVTQKVLLTQDSIAADHFIVGFADSLKRKLGVMYKWKEGSVYKLTLLPGALTDFSGQINDTIALFFHAIVSEEYGSLQLVLTNVPEGNMILQLLKGEEGGVRQMKINGGGKYEFKVLDPGKYRVALHNDRNGNGRWDTGNYMKKIAPEPVYYFNGEIQVRANWEMEQEWKVEQ